MSHDHAAIGRRWFEQVWNQKNIDAADQLATPDCKAHGHAPNDAVIGIPEFKDFARNVMAAFPDIKIAVEDTVSEGNRAVIRWNATGTHSGDFMGTKATGRKIMVRGISIMHFVDGKVAEAWDNWDQLGMLTQIGAIPASDLAKAS
jgi:steroid delta-isomerase-like uncharacterized protein